MTRIYGRGKASERVNDYVPDVRFERTTLISSIRLDGEQATFMFQGSSNHEVFACYVKEVLAPSLKPGDIVVLDNYSIHKVKGVLDPIIEKGANYMFLPPYSPDLNPIELAWSKMKSILRKLRPRTLDELIEAVISYIDNVTINDIKGWFGFMGYMINA